MIINAGMSVPASRENAQRHSSTHQWYRLLHFNHFLFRRPAIAMLNGGRNQWKSIIEERKAKNETFWLLKNADRGNFRAGGGEVQQLQKLYSISSTSLY